MSIKCGSVGFWSCLFLLAFLVGCGPGGSDGSSTEEGAQTEESATEPEAPAPDTAGTPQPPKQLWLAASHILIQYAGSARGADSVTRTKEEAQSLAADLAEQAKGGADFAELAKKHSDGPSAPRGGNLGVFPASRMVPVFSQAAALLAVGEVSDPVETQFGFHVIRRDREVELVSARHILVMHTGSTRAPEGITRTPEEARARAEEALEKARSGGDFAQLAAEYSDGPTKVQGGDLGAFPKGAMVPAFDDAVFGLEVGALSGIVETPFGYHIILRYE